MQLSGDLYLTRKCSLLGIGDREKETEREIERERERERERETDRETERQRELGLFMIYF